jgi:hypothetical protein
MKVKPWRKLRLFLFNLTKILFPIDYALLKKHQVSRYAAGYHPSNEHHGGNVMRAVWSKVVRNYVP